MVLIDGGVPESGSGLFLWLGSASLGLPLVDLVYDAVIPFK